MAKTVRPDRFGNHRKTYESNRNKILKMQTICGICGNPVDKTLKFPDPFSPVVDHIVPIVKGGHPSDINNLQLAHHRCNREKSDKIFKNIERKEKTVLGNRNLPQSRDWKNYKLVNPN